MKVLRTRFGLKSLIGLVALCSLLFWGLRMRRESQPDRLYAGWLREAGESRRLQAAEELGKLDSTADDDLVGTLARSMLGDSSATVRKQSALSLANVVEPWNDTARRRFGVGVLVRALSDPDSAVRAAAAEGLGKIAREPDPAIPGLIKAAKDEDEWVRGAAIAALGLVQKNAGVDREEVRGAIMAAIREESLHVRELGIYAFWATAEKSPGFTRAILKDPDIRNRRAALSALARNGVLASAVIPELNEALADPDAAIREGATRTLQNAGLPTTAFVPAEGPSP